MTGSSHRLIAASGAVLLGASPLHAAAATLGATLPDFIERVGLKHRGVSHWPVPWVGLAYWWLNSGEPVMVLLGWMIAGAIFHIVSDLFTIAGVPLLLPPWRMRLGFLRTGKMGEYVVAAGMVSLAVMKVLHVPITLYGS